MRLMAILGLLIALGGAGTLAWNEYALARQLGAVAAARASLEGAADGAGQVVHLVAEATAAGPVRDPLFGVAAEALRLDRTAETYQWLEVREGTGRNKNLRYDKVWSPVLIPSERFEQRSFHANPPRLPISSARLLAQGVRLAELELDPAIGDVRVRFATAPVGLVSVVAGLIGNQLLPSHAPGGAALALAAYGDVPA